MALSDFQDRVTTCTGAHTVINYTIGVEHNNDDARRNYASSNHFDAPREILLAETRLEKLSKFNRPKRQYEKDTEYWEKTIFEKRCRLE